MSKKSSKPHFAEGFCDQTHIITPNGPMPVARLETGGGSTVYLCATHLKKELAWRKGRGWTDKPSYIVDVT